MQVYSLPTELISMNPHDQNTVPRYSSFEEFFRDSKLWHHLKGFEGAEVAQLQATIQQVAEESKAISKKIIACMPFYTLHDER